jgi:DUF2945 family protein
MTTHIPRPETDSQYPIMPAGVGKTREQALAFLSIYFGRSTQADGIVTAEMAKAFKRSDHVEWNSEAGRVSAVIVKKVVSAIRFKGYVHHASRDEPQYIIKSDKTEHIAIHKGSALKRVKARIQRTRLSGKKGS